MATGRNLPARRSSKSGAQPGAVRVVAGTVADGYRYVRTREPGFIAGAAPVSLFVAAGGVADPTSAGSLLVGAVGAAGSLRYLTSSEHAKRNRAMRKIGKALVSFDLKEPDGQAPRMKNLVFTPAGKKVDIRVPKRSAALLFERLIPALEDELGAIVRIEQIPAPKFGPVAAASKALDKATRNASRKPEVKAPVKALMPRGGVRLSIVERDTLAAPLTTPWPVIVPDAEGRIPERRWYEPVPVGMDEDGEPVRFSWETTPSLLISGESGAGKSVGTHELVSAWLLDALAEAVLWDGKGELEFVDYAALAIGLAGPDPTRAARLAGAAVVELERRLGLLKDLGLKKADRDDPRFPPLLLAVEEFTAYAKNPEFLALLQYLLVRIRAVNMRMLLTTQRPSSKVIDTDIRDNVSARWAFRMNTHSSSDMCLGPGWASNGWSAMSIPAGDTHKGVGLLLHDGGSPRRLRTWYSGDDMPARVAVRAMGLRGIDPSSASGGAAEFLSGGDDAGQIAGSSAPAAASAVKRPASSKSAPSPAPAAVAEPAGDPDSARKAHNATQMRSRRSRNRPSQAQRRALQATPSNSTFQED